PRAGVGKRGPPLTGSGLGGQPLDAVALVVVHLRRRGVRLVGASGADALVLVIDSGRCLQRLLKATSTVERAGPPLLVDITDRIGNLDELLGAAVLLEQLRRGQ